MRRILTTTALAAVAIAAGSDVSPARAQQPTAIAQPPVTYQQPMTVARPATAYYVQPHDSRAVLPAFSPRGGIGTTPFLGNTRGLGAFSVNYDKVPRSAYTYPSTARPRRWFRRNY